MGKHNTIWTILLQDEVTTPHRNLAMFTKSVPDPEPRDLAKAGWGYPNDRLPRGAET